MTENRGERNAQVARGSGAFCFANTKPTRMMRVAKGRKRVLKVCPNCGSTEVKPAKMVDEWAPIEEQLESSGGDKYECHECGYRGELIGIAEAPEEDELPEDEELEEAPKNKELHSTNENVRVGKKAKKAVKTKPKKKGKK
ncbi:MAG: hypothetical protein ABH863_02265 [Candidatus Micrarchaeota archaeon]